MLIVHVCLMPTNYASMTSATLLAELVFPSVLSGATGKLAENPDDLSRSEYCVTWNNNNVTRGLSTSKIVAPPPPQSS